MNCRECKHKQGFGERRVCAVGNTELLDGFYERNGQILIQDITESVPCYEQTEGDRLLDSMINKMDGILKLVRGEAEKGADSDA